MRRRSLLLAGVAAIVVLAAVGTAIALVDGGGPQRYETDEFSFEYPGEWQAIEGIDLPVAELAGRGDVADNVVGLDLDNWVVVYVGAYRGPQITDETVKAFLPVYRETLPAAVQEGAEGEVLGGPYVTREADRPAIRMRYRLANNRGVVVVSDVIQIFAGGRDYIVTCNAQADRELEMAAGCQQIIDTLAFGAP
jgi:hypothetical protein